MSKKKKEVTIHEIYSKNTFLKVKPVFNIGKIVFSFVETDKKTKKAIKETDCFMSVADAALFARKITSFRIYRMLEEEKKKGAEYPEDIWTSRLGGKSEEEAKRPDGLAISRRFTLAPGSKKYAVFTAIQQPGESNEQGLIVPYDTGNPGDIERIRVPVESHEELEKLGIMIEAAVFAYFSTTLTSTTTQTNYDNDSYSRNVNTERVEEAEENESQLSQYSFNLK